MKELNEQELMMIDGGSWWTHFRDKVEDTVSDGAAIYAGKIILNAAGVPIP
ncbi:hypothetical protein BX659_13529 [Orenia metallireducens]|uniref:Uncharacterized protein n=1 Tax=Orenia metallireducens TaxID=1413210 RepID=A0A285IDW8_9FIRM|nr:hypothetical protein [Orenia metallireducens]PRX20629.1 hypothetical protein BX659_13529 [Orenia metallireducens]SNY45266.1 hypothetical protein SAMN06265827_13730 [Orenia metallireducens]